MMVHTEDIRRIVEVTTEVDETCGYFVLCLKVITAGNVHKVVRIPHMQADALRVGLVGEFESMDDQARKESWNANLQALRGSK